MVGEGNQAKVRKAKHRVNGHIYAIKSIDLSGLKLVSKRTLQQELSHLAATKHPNIVASNEAFFVNGKLKLLMEYMDVGPLSTLVRSYGPIAMPVLAIMAKQVTYDQ